MAACYTCNGQRTVRESRIDSNGKLIWVKVKCPSCSGTGRA